MANTNTLSNLLTDPVRNFKFLVKFLPKDANDGKTQWDEYSTTFGFISVSGLSISTESIAYREGGYNTNVHQIPGQTAFQPISLSKGVMLGQQANKDWMKRLFSVLTDTTPFGSTSNFRCDLEIQVLTHPNPKLTIGNDSAVPVAPQDAHTSLRFYVYNAWITSLTYSNLDAGSNSIMVEDITLVHEGFDVKYGKNLDSGNSAGSFATGGTY
jgi:phage tail-like protein